MKYLFDLYLTDRLPLFLQGVGRFESSRPGKSQHGIDHAHASCYSIFTTAMNGSGKPSTIILIYKNVSYVIRTDEIYISKIADTVKIIYAIHTTTTYTAMNA